MVTRSVMSELAMARTSEGSGSPLVPDSPGFTLLQSESMPGMLLILSCCSARQVGNVVRNDPSPYIRHTCWARSSTDSDFVWFSGFEAPVALLFYGTTADRMYVLYTKVKI